MSGLATGRKNWVTTGIRGLALLATVSPLAVVQAQTVAPAEAPVPAPGQDDASKDIVVVGVRASIQSSIAKKRDETIISDSLSASDIDGLPATNLGDAIATIPGATTHREKGAASEIAIGGLGPFLASVNVNGRETTTGNGKRSVNFYLFPSELINAVAVNKTQRADLIEGGTSGTIDSRTLKPLDRKKRQVQVSARGILTGYNHKLNDPAGLGHRFTGSYVDQFDLGSAGELGVLVGVQYQRGNSPEELLGGGSTWNACRGDVNYTASQTCTPVTPQNYGTTAVPAGTPYYFATTSRNNIQFTTRDKRLAWIGDLQWKSPGGIEVNLDAQISDYRFNEERQSFSLSETTRGMSNIVFGPDHVLQSYSGNSYGESTSTYRIQDEKYRGGGLNIKIPVTDRFTIAADASLSRTRRERADRSVRLRTNATDISGNVVPGVTTGSTGGRIPYTFENFPDGTQSLVLNSAFDPDNADNYSAAARLRRDAQIRWHDNDAARLDATWTPDIAFIRSIAVGGRWSSMRFRSVESDRREYNFNVGSTATPFSGAPGTYNVLLATMAAANRACRESFPQKDFLSSDSTNTINSWASFDARCLFQNFIGTDEPGLNADTRSIANRNVKEITKAGYVTAAFGGDLGTLPFSGNIGLRFVSTDVTSNGLRGGFDVVDNGNGTIRLVSNGQFNPLVDRYHYDRWLPSLNLSFDVTDAFKVRGAFSRSMTKPDPASLANGRTFSLDASQTSFPDVRSAISSITASGNPRTNPLMSWNYDLSLEYYLNKDSVFSLRLFHKDFQGGFVNTIQNETYTIGGETFTVPVNVLQSTNKSNWINGFEVSASYRASFLPAPFNGLGFRGSWSHSASNFKQEDLRLGEQVDPTTGTVYSRLADPVGIFGLSKNVVTAAPYFQYKGFEASAIYKFRSAYYQQFVGDPAQNRVVRAEGTVDIALRYRVNKNLSLEIQGTNITDTPRYQDMPVPGSFKEASYYGPTYFFGATYKF
ncbi:TonB-dependent receptor [Sphingomonas sp. ERG5]|uniref:TonB-dependent receptor n=1 Tax=Sphingomonas sp. ERG5 TaxID=1381597 RepID=UPI0013649DD9|nr:TonB-dependent receptor [Sphingomonas sp. ERG5]